MLESIRSHPLAMGKVVMKIILLTDLEGIQGVNDIGYMERDSEKYKWGCLALAESINRATKICLENGVSAVYYLDGHGGGGNVTDEMIDRRAIRITIDEWAELMEKGCIDGLIEIGAHARAGTLNGFLDHTMNSKKWFSYTINGREMSELSLQACFCAQFGVPIIACTGDLTACEQAREYLPELPVGIVKVAEGRNQAVSCANGEQAFEEAIRMGLIQCKQMPLLQMELPLTVELTFYRSDYCEEALAGAEEGTQRVGARTLRKQVEKIKAYRDLLF